MAIVKIQQVRSLSRAIQYCSQDYKIPDNFVYCHHCIPEDIYSSFKHITNLYNQKKGTNLKQKARMIIQSFDSKENISAEEAHEIAIELCKRYFKDEHQYIIYTHQDRDHIHNHIIFNSINFKTLKMFDSSRQNTINNLRIISDQIVSEHGLSIIEPKEKSKGMSFAEYLVRAKGKSFKGKLEEVIDKNILNSKSYEEFLEKMETEGYSFKEDKYLSFKNNSMKKFVRSKSLGVHYSINSIKYRIENKDFSPIKINIIDKKWIDKTDNKFIENKGLRAWAINQNIKYYEEVLRNLNQGKTLKQISVSEERAKEIVNHFERKIEEIDLSLYEITKAKSAFIDYSNSYNLIKEFKESSDKEAFKKLHYSEFKIYDQAKKNLSMLEKKYSITSKDNLDKLITTLKLERNTIYSTLSEKSLLADHSKKQENQHNKEI
ncbi:TPA: relaxase/mobilization nuclease domain-containing protein [Streptococcus pyogenes]